MLQEISLAVEAAAQELLERAQLEPGSILVVGCSTSEVQGQHIGSAGNREVAAAILQPVSYTHLSHCGQCDSNQ